MAPHIHSDTHPKHPTNCYQRFGRIFTEVMLPLHTIFKSVPEQAGWLSDSKRICALPTLALSLQPSIPYLSTPYYRGHGSIVQLYAHLPHLLLRHPVFSAQYFKGIPGHTHSTVPYTPLSLSAYTLLCLMHTGKPLGVAVRHWRTPLDPV